MYSILTEVPGDVRIEPWLELEETTDAMESDMQPSADPKLLPNEGLHFEDDMDFNPHTVDGKYLFFSGNPAVELVKGTIHLFNEVDKQLDNYNQKLPRKRTRMVCVIAVPSWLTIADFLNFCGKYSKSFEQIRILAGSSPSRYMVVSKCRTQADADNFYKDFNCKQFSSLGGEVCYIGFVKRVEFMTPSIHKSGQGRFIQELFPHHPPTLREIPTCPVCLETLDATESGILTIPCQHTFHSECLTRWKDDDTCPVCRFKQTPSGKDSKCLKCGTRDNLWLCLLCGHIGCSRYSETHAYEHFTETMHNYALDIETQRVWDYAGDGYVHRLIQNETDGKFVELPSPSASSDFREGEGKSFKLDSVMLEYQYLMTAQLETQRSWYEDIMKAQEDKYTTMLEKLKKEKEVVSMLKDKAFEKLRNLERETKDLQQSDYEKTKLIKDLQEQVRDLMLHFEAQKTVKRREQDGDIDDGNVVKVKNMDNKVLTVDKITLNPNGAKLHRKLKK